MTLTKPRPLPITPEPEFTSLCAYLRWHKDDSAAALERYEAQFTQTDHLLHTHEVTDSELDKFDRAERSRARRYGTLTGNLEARGNRQQMGVGRTHEPQSRTLRDDQGLTPEGAWPPSGHGH